MLASVPGWSALSFVLRVSISVMKNKLAKV